MALYTTGNQPLPGYPQPWGDKKHDLVDHYGPASYTTGGEAFSTNSNGPLGGIVGIEGVIPIGLSASGTYFVVWKATSPSVAQPVQAGKLVWYLAGTWTEVTATTNLAAETVRLLIFGV